MSAPSKLTQEQREQAIDLFEKGHRHKVVAHRLGLPVWSVERLEYRWRLRGKLALVANPSKKTYSFETKLLIARRYLEGETANALAAEYQVSTPRLVQRWAQAYREHGEQGLHSKKPGRKPAPAPGADPVADLERENEYLRAKVAYLEKLKALRQQGLR